MNEDPEIKDNQSKKDELEKFKKELRNNMIQK